MNLKQKLKNPGEVFKLIRVSVQEQIPISNNLIKWIRKNIQIENINLYSEILITMLTVKKASEFWLYLKQLGWLEFILPSLNNTYLCEGGPYHEEDVFTHCMAAGDHCSIKHPLIKLAAYLHDVGKPISKRINPKTGKIWFNGHDKSGCLAVKKDLTEIGFPEFEVNFISNLVGLHMRISHDKLSQKAVRKTLVFLNDCQIDYMSLIRLAICDKMGNIKARKRYRLSDIIYLVRAFKNENEKMNKKPEGKFSKLTINGHDVIETLGISPGIAVGRILEILLRKIEDCPELNDREYLLKFLKETYVH